MTTENLTIRSHKGPYEVRFDDDALARLNADVPDGVHFIVDGRVADLYATDMDAILSHPSVLRIDATESNKSLDRFPAYVQHLIDRGIRREHVLIAIGGGITQDITCFLAATLLRGVDWRFYPTTLLAQADSCIGSKSSINSGSAKNILGTFTPPKQVFVSTRFLETLDERDVRSGVGEMIKVQVIDGPKSFDAIARSYDSLFTDPVVMEHFIHRSLDVKKGYIERDEFDRGPRNVFNYGHSFGHAIEAATDFAVPHGIAVTMGMDMANWLAARLGIGDDAHWARMHPVLRGNYRGYETTEIPLDPFFSALSKDKKNVGQGTVTLILPDRDARVFRDAYPADDAFRAACRHYLEDIRRS